MISCSIKKELGENLLNLAANKLNKLLKQPHLNVIRPTEYYSRSFKMFSLAGALNLNSDNS